MTYLRRWRYVIGETWNLRSLRRRVLDQSLTVGERGKR